MTQVFAYLRVSTDAQDAANQKHGIVEYCRQRSILAPLFIEDTISGKTDWCHFQKVTARNIKSRLHSLF